MDKFAFTHINANMAEGAAHRVEENQIAGLQVGSVYFFGRGCLLAGPTGQDQTGGLLKNRTDKAAAIKTTIGVCAPALVGDTKESHGIYH
jgi:hypothetical protein